MSWPVRLPLLMLGINLLGVLAGFLRDPGGPFWSPLAFLTTGVLLLAPLAPLALLAHFLARRSALEATLGGLLAAGAAACCCFILLDPELNRDANIGLGLYWMFGVIFPLGAAYLLGIIAGKLWPLVRQKNYPQSP